jgi:hypothetical protein
MHQWYKCPQCGKDILYSTNPCPHCKWTLDWRQQPPTVYMPPTEEPRQQIVQPSVEASQQQGVHPHIYQQPVEAPQPQAIQYSSTAKPDNEKATAQKKNVVIGCVAVIITGIVIFALIGVCSNSISQTTPETNQAVPKLTISEIKSKAITIPYDDLMRYNERYVGDIVYYRGKIMQIVNSYGDNYTIRLATKQSEYLGYSDNIIWVNYKGERLLEKDIIDVWGKVKGLQDYSALFGNQITIPAVDSLYTILITKGAE